MNIVQVTPGAGRMYCGNCLRDNALVAAYRRLGHRVLMVPLYLPITLDEPDESRQTPVFFGGLTVYLDHRIPAFRAAPAWLRRPLSHPALLRWTARFAARTRAADVADLTLSMLRGEAGNQARDLDEFVAWLRTQPPPDVVCLSNALLLGLARRLKATFDVRISCLLAGEDAFLDAMPEPHRSEIWATLAERIREVDVIVAPSRHYASRMADRLGLPPSRVTIIPVGLNLEGYPEPSPLLPEPPAAQPATLPPTVGFFARMCPDKGLDTLVDAFIQLCRRNRVPGLRLEIGGGCGPTDEPFVEDLRRRLATHSLLERVGFHPNLDREAKIAFLRTLTVFSVPARSGEAFGLYLLEALAAGVPVVQPNTAAFPEIVADTGGGVLYEPDAPGALADALEALLLDPRRRSDLAAAGQRAVHERYGALTVARKMIGAFTAAPSSACAVQVPSFTSTP
jgi:glycosyltransferase involved in cell wall biosynthesis